jgi:hypothetical protein
LDRKARTISLHELVIIQQKPTSGAFFDDDFSDIRYAAEKPPNSIQQCAPIALNRRIIRPDIDDVFERGSDYLHSVHPSGGGKAWRKSRDKVPGLILARMF